MPNRQTDQHLEADLCGSSNEWAATTLPKEFVQSLFQTHSSYPWDGVRGKRKLDQLVEPNLSIFNSTLD